MRTTRAAMALRGLAWASNDVDHVRLIAGCNLILMDVIYHTSMRCAPGRASADAKYARGEAKYARGTHTDRQIVSAAALPQSVVIIHGGHQKPTKFKELAIWVKKSLVSNFRWHAQKLGPWTLNDVFMIGSMTLEATPPFFFRKRCLRGGGGGIKVISAVFAKIVILN